MEERVHAGRRWRAIYKLVKESS